MSATSPRHPRRAAGPPGIRCRMHSCAGSSSFSGRLSTEAIASLQDQLRSSPTSTPSSAQRADDRPEVGRELSRMAHRLGQRHSAHHRCYQVIPQDLARPAEPEPDGRHGPRGHGVLRAAIARSRPQRPALVGPHRGDPAVRPRAGLRSRLRVRQRRRVPRRMGHPTRGPGRGTPWCAATRLRSASRAATLNWDATAPATVIVGNSPPEEGVSVIGTVHSTAQRHGRGALAVIQGDGWSSSSAASCTGARRRARVHGRHDGQVLRRAVVDRPTTPSLAPPTSVRSRRGRDGGRSSAGVVRRARCSRTELLPERALLGDTAAVRRLTERLIQPLTGSGTALADTLDPTWTRRRRRGLCPSAVCSSKIRSDTA